MSALYDDDPVREAEEVVRDYADWREAQTARQQAAADYLPRLQSAITAAWVAAELGEDEGPCLATVAALLDEIGSVDEWIIRQMLFDAISNGVQSARTTARAEIAAMYETPLRDLPAALAPLPRRRPQ